MQAGQYEYAFRHVARVLAGIDSSADAAADRRAALLGLDAAAAYALRFQRLQRIAGLFGDQAIVAFLFDRLQTCYECASRLCKPFAPVLVVQIVPLCHSLDLEDVQRKRVLLEPVKALLPVDLDVFVRVEIVREHDHQNLQPFGFQDIQTADHGVLSGCVAVIGNIDLLDIAFQKPCLLLCQGRAEAGNRIFDPCLVQADHIHVALDHDEVVELFVFVQIQPVQVVALIVYRRVACVDILGLFVTHHACAEAQNLSVDAEDRKDQPSAKRVVYRSALRVLHKKARVDKLLFGVALAF